MQDESRHLRYHWKKRVLQALWEKSVKALCRSWSGRVGALLSAEGSPGCCLHRAGTQGERENQGYIGVHQDLSKISILSFVVSFLDTLIRECGVFLGLGYLCVVLLLVATLGICIPMCVWLLWKQVCVCVLLLAKACVCVLNKVEKFLTLWGSGRRSRGTEPL